MQRLFSRFKITFLLLLLCSTCYGRIGLADWSNKTPGGNEINNFVDLSIFLKNGTEITNVSEWYFYKDYIIGWRHKEGWAHDTSNYFIINELTLEIDTFTSKTEWTRTIVSRNLNPKIYTRWYSNDWTIIDSGFFLFLIGGFPLTILFLFLFYKAVSKEGFNIRKPYTIIIMCTLGLFFIIWLLDQYPSSI